MPSNGASAAARSRTGARRRSLLVKFVLAFVFVLLPVLGVLLWGLDADLRYSEEDVLRNQTFAAEAIALQVEETFDSALGLAWAVANDPLSRQLSGRDLDAHLQNLVKATSRFDAIAVFDQNGVNRGWGSTETAPEALEKVAQASYFQSVLGTNAPVISEVIQLRGGADLGILALVPLRGNRGEPVGAVVVLLKASGLAKQYNDTKFQPGQCIFLLDRNGRLAFHSTFRFMAYEQSGAFMGSPFVRRALSGTPNTVNRFRSPLLGDLRLGAFVPTPVTRWAVGVTVTRSVALAPIRAALIRQLLGFFASLTLSGVIALFVARNLTAPLRRLRVHAQALGSGDLSHRVKVDTGDELEDLADAVNEMAFQIQDREEEIRALNASLEQRVAERTAELEAANKELEAFSYSLSHDLRTPLRSVNGFSRLLLKDYAGKLDEEGRDYLKRICAASVRMGELFEDVVDLFRVNRAVMERRPVDLSQLACFIADELRAAHPERSVELIIAPGLVAEADARLMRIALENLLSNAWKFTSRQPVARIEFGGMHRDGEAEYFVRDNGAGFDMAHAQQLFHPFQRLHTPLEFPGSGIGLAIVQRIIQRHSGKIWAQAEVGRGATFYFTLNAHNESDGPSL